MKIVVYVARKGYDIVIFSVLKLADCAFLHRFKRFWFVLLVTECSDNLGSYLLLRLFSVPCTVQVISNTHKETGPTTNNRQGEESKGKGVNETVYHDKNEVEKVEEIPPMETLSCV